MSPEESEILAVERKLARAESEARTLRQELAGVRQGLRDLGGAISQVAPVGHPIAGFTGLYPDQLLATDSQFGPVPLTWSAADGNWHGQITVNIPARPAPFGCPAANGLVLSYGLNHTLTGDRINLFYSSFHTSGCPQVGGDGTGFVPFKDAPGSTSAPLLVKTTAYNFLYQYIYTITGQFPTVVVTNPADTP